MLEPGLQQLTAEQHQNLSTVFNKVELDCKKCCEVSGDQITSHKAIDIPLRLFWPLQSEGIPKLLESVTPFVRKAKQPLEVSMNTKICHVIQDIVHHRGFFGSLDRDVEAAFDEIVGALE